MVYEQSGSLTVISVSTAVERLKLLRKIHQEVETDRPANQEVYRQNNNVKLFSVHNGGYVLLKTWIVVVMPITINLINLEGFDGEVTFYLDNTIQKLKMLTVQLENLNGRRCVNGGYNESELKKLVNSLC